MRLGRESFGSAVLDVLECIGAFLIADLAGLSVGIVAVVCARLLEPSGARVIAGIALGLFIGAALGTAVGPAVAGPLFAAQRPFATQTARLAGSLVLIAVVEFARQERVPASPNDQRGPTEKKEQ